VFLADGVTGDGSEVGRRAARVTAMLAARLPGEFRGYPVRFPPPGNRTASRGTGSRFPALAPG